MLSDLIDRLVRLGVESHAIEIRHPDAEPKHVYLVRDRVTGETERKLAEPEPRQHRVGDLAALMETAQHYASEDDSDGVVWYSRSGVVLVIDDDTRRDRVVLPLELSPQVKELLKLEANPRPLDQVGLRKLLRTTFKECLTSCPNLIANISAVNWTLGDEGQSKVGHGAVSMGKRLEAKIQGLEVLPEYVTLHVPLFVAGVGRLSAPVQLALEPDPVNKTFSLIPLPLEIENAIISGERRIGEMLGDGLSEAGVQVFYGQP